MKGSVEAGNDRHLGQQSSQRPDACERQRLVERSQGDERLERCEHVVVHATRAHELRAPVDDPVSDHADVAAAVDEAPDGVVVVG